MRRVSAYILAGVLTLALAAPAAAATITDDLTIATAVSMSGVPAVLHYGTVTPGVASSAQTFTVTITANADWVVDIYGDAFTGPGSLGASARQARATNVVGSGIVNSIASYQAFGSGGLSGPGPTAAELSGGPQSGATADLSFRILAPASTAPGAYTGTFTVTIAAF